MPDPAEQLRNAIQNRHHGYTEPEGSFLIDPRAPRADARIVGGEAGTVDHGVAVQNLYAHAYEISGDGEGSDPRPYFSPQDYAELMALCDFLDIQHEPWPEAEELEFSDPRTRLAPTHKTEQHLQPSGVHWRWLPPRLAGFWRSAPTSGIWSSDRGAAISGLTRAVYYRGQHDRPVGYRLGRLKILEQPIAIGSDRLLYALRGAELKRGAVSGGGSRQIRSLGWGALPDPDFLSEADATTHRGGFIEYGIRKHQTLTQVITNRIPDGRLDPARLPVTVSPPIVEPPPLPDAFDRHYDIGKIKRSN